MVGPSVVGESTFPEKNIPLWANASDQPNFVIWEGFTALFEHISMAEVEIIKNAISIDPQDFFVLWH